MLFRDSVLYYFHGGILFDINLVGVEVFKVNPAEVEELSDLLRRI